MHMWMSFCGMHDGGQVLLDGYEVESMVISQHNPTLKFYMKSGNNHMYECRNRDAQVKVAKYVGDALVGRKEFRRDEYAFDLGEVEKKMMAQD